VYNPAAVRSTRPPPPPPAPQRNVQFGPYTLVDRIAVGGMAEVFRAREPRQAGEPRIVVVKRMLPHIAAHPGTRAMFDEEARLGACIRHPSVVEVLGRGHEGGQPYLALEYVPGVDLWRLGRWLAREGSTLGTPLAVFIACELLAALHAVHEARGPDGAPLDIIHRDVSPSNVLLSVHGDIKLGDFGIAQRRLQEELGEDTFPQRAKGKLGYLSPEQVVGAPLDRRSDVFATAVILGELLMGRPVFSGASELAILLAIRDAHIHSFLEIGASLPSGLVEAVAGALARDPDERVGTAHELRERLMPFQTEPEPALRRELGDLVAAAMGSTSEAPEATPMREVGPHASPGGSDALAHPLAPSEPPVDGVPTGDLQPITYQIRRGDAGMLGPWTYARAVQAVSTGRIGPTDRVSVGGGAFRPLAEVPELARHLPVSSFTPATRDAVAPPTPDDRTSIEAGGFVAGLAGSVLRGASGLWLCEQGSVRKEIYVTEGVPEFVTSNLAGELLGEYLVGRSVISRGELDMALAVIPRFDGRLGDTLVALGLVEPVQLFRHIADQVREKLLDVFLWRSGTASFYQGVRPPKSGFPLGLDPWRILDEGIGRRIAHGLEAERWRGHGRIVRADPPPPELDGVRWPAPLAQARQHLAAHPIPWPPPDQATSSGALRAGILLAYLGAARLAEAQPP
jgi:eukaryotic-like serine/threonine-protein kinase